MAEQEVPERHASWLELFFDLIIVVAVAQLAHVLHPSPGHPIGLSDAGLFIVLYYAVWSVWTSFTLYANVAGERTRRQSMLIAMFGIAVMAAAIPEAAGDRARAFAIAYVACRVLATRTWSRTGTFLGAWPAAQYGAGLTPWLISIWVPAPGRYWLWGFGVAADIVISYLQSRDPEQQLAELRDEAHRQRMRASLRGRVPRRIVLPAGARLNIPHLGERLGLFVIIVLGEAGPAVLVPVLLAVFGGGLAAWWIVVGLLAVAYWQVNYPTVMRRLGRPE
ncbi:low temperature requirement protein A [Acrocarpospora sp. B8E8]|uniref:low temperature requirement protein A n=1 Tax=Acrocarpospora sp. B8E8 TaxID=3153572 RepID=UPI00325C6BD0